MQYLLYEQIQVRVVSMIIYENICLNDEIIQNENLAIIDYE